MTDQWSAPWLYGRPGDAWDQWQEQERWAADRARRRRGNDREDRFVRRWDEALCDRRGSERDRAQREAAALAEITSELWRAADGGDEWARDVRPQWMARLQAAQERVAATYGPEVLRRELWLFGGDREDTVAPVAPVALTASDGDLSARYARGYVEVPRDAEDAEQRVLAEDAVALACEALDLSAKLRRSGVAEDKLTPTVRFLGPASEGQQPDFPPHEDGVSDGMSLWPSSIWLRQGLTPRRLVEVVGHEVAHIAQGDPGPDEPAFRMRQHEAAAVAWEREFVRWLTEQTS